MAGAENDGTPIVVLFRNDLRMRDNRALHAAAAFGRPVVPLFVLDEREGARPLGGARRWWLHRSLEALSTALSQRGCSLHLRRGSTAAVLDEIVAVCGAAAVFWNRRYDPPGMAADAALKRRLRAESFDGHLLHEPSQLQTASGGPYKVYSAFRRALDAGPEPRDPLPAPIRITPYHGTLPSDDLDAWKLLPRRPDWSGGLEAEWTPGEAGAQARLDAFLADGVEGYAAGRDFPASASTSRLSPHLAHGEITPFQIRKALAAHDDAPAVDREKFRAELAWREFSYHLLFHNPDLAEQNYSESFESFPWVRDPAGAQAWRLGMTGYPIVDAGMRELWITGWMHNRVRMIAASFLTKHLMQDWRDGEKWFWDTLVDADPANNPASWQWVAGSGADAAPYFRIFNPVLQGEKFDPAGDYVRRFVPELAALPDRFVHRPWEAGREVLARAGVTLGRTYPAPVVDHGHARERALGAYRDTKGKQ